MSLIQGYSAADMRAQMVRGLLDGLGQSVRPPDVDPCANTKEFVDRYALKMDRAPFDWDRYSYSVEPYECGAQWIVLMAAAQTMKSAFMMSWFLRHHALEWGCLAGAYFPDKDVAGRFSNNRFAPFVRSSRILAKHFGTDVPGDTKGQDAVHTRTFGPGTEYFLSALGKSATEGLPLRIVMVDEVRRISIGDMERIQKRMAAQAQPWFVAGSTASYEQSSISVLFAETDQRHFHTSCATDLDGIALSREFPGCIADLRKATPLFKRKVEAAFDRAGVRNLGVPDFDVGKWPDACYIHPRTGEILPDPRNGVWEPHAKSSWKRGYQISQMHSWNHPAGRILAEYERSLDLAEFYWSVLGISYTDENKIPVKQEYLEAAQNERLVWAMNQTEAWRKRWVKNTAMGVDVQHGYLVAVVKERAPNGKHRTIHVEIVYDGPVGQPDITSNGWKRLGKLMGELNVRRCVVDGAPLHDSARHFALSFPGRVWLADYNYAQKSGESDICKWLDARSTATQRGDQQRFSRRCTIDRTKALDWSLGRWKRAANETPKAGTLVQVLPCVSGAVRLAADLREGEWEPRPICRDLYWPHQRGVIFRDTFEGNDDRALDAQRVGKIRIVAEHVGLDPHFAHANMFADLALDAMPSGESAWEG